MRRMLNFMSHAIRVKARGAWLMASQLLLASIFVPTVALAQADWTSESGLTIFPNSDRSLTVSRTGGASDGSWIWTARGNDGGANETWRFFLQDEEKGYVTIRPAGAIHLCLSPVRTYSVISSAQLWYTRLEACNVSSENLNQVYVLQPSGLATGRGRDGGTYAGEYTYVIRSKSSNLANHCLNIAGGVSDWRPLVHWPCQSGAANDRFHISSTSTVGRELGIFSSADTRKISEWAVNAMLYAHRQADGTISSLAPFETATASLGFTGYAAALIPGKGINIVSNETGLDIEDAQKFAETRAVTFQYGLSQSFSTQVTLGKKDVYAVAFTLAFGANQSWTQQTQTTAEYTKKIPVPAFSSAWLAMGHSGTQYSSKFRMTTSLGDTFTTAPVTATVVTSTNGYLANCSNQGQTDQNSYFTMGYVRGSPCQVSRPGGLQAPTSWAPGTLHWNTPPEDFIFVEGTTQAPSQPKPPAPTPPAPTPPTPPAPVPPISDGLQTGVDYKISVNTGYSRCLDVYRNTSGNVGTWECKSSGFENQRWRFTDADSDGYRLIFAYLTYPQQGSNNCFQASPGYDSRIVSGSCHTAPEGKWKYNPTTGTLINKSDATRCLTAPTADALLGRYENSMRQCDSSNVQRWTIAQ